MEINALMMAQTDNVVTCVSEVTKGSEVVWRNGDSFCTIVAEEDIPFCHKIALKDFEPEEEVIKYGEMIGRTRIAIKKGHWVNHENIYSVLRDYDSEMLGKGGN